MSFKPVAVFALILSSSMVARGVDAKDADALQGAWLLVSAEFGGKPFPEEFTKSTKLVIKDATYAVTVREQADKGTFNLNPTAKPKEMDITGVDGPNKGKTFPAIYELNADTLKVCYDLGGKTRPTEFMTKKDTQQFLATYKREKK